ncbi:MAG: type 2 isopentenyl-diphosphate Delta-isomerase [Chloroflexota bacterium]|nr:type 2 isopentenyl-diphosphate Delta-isomerase [Chloroflexota bacterium]
MSYGKRKDEHLEICLNEDVTSALTTGLEKYRLVHNALPEIALEEVSTESRFLGHGLCAPFLISAMTGGSEPAQEINRRLATAAQQLGLAMGLGSQRASIENPDLTETYQVRDYAPDILLLANLGAVQLNYGYGAEECRHAVESVQADGLVLHLNPLQEALQPEGNTDFRGLLEKIGHVCETLEYPVLIKEVGWGLSARTATLLQKAGVAALDVSGAGGTSWSRVEQYRSHSSIQAEVAGAFDAWGLPTAESLIQVRETCPHLPLVASGGISDGVQAAMCLALGANLVGIGRPLLHPARESTEAVVDRLTVIVRQLRTAMFATGAATLARLDASRIERRN